MSIKDRIEEWKNTANAIGSEARAAVLVGEIAAALDEATPPEVTRALKVFGLRSVMREIVPFYQGILADEHDGLHVGDDNGLGSVSLVLMNEFVPGGFAEGMVQSSIEVGQRSENVFPRQSCWNGLGHGCVSQTTQSKSTFPPRLTM